MLVRDHLGKPVSQVPVNLVDRQEFSSTGGVGDMSCHRSSTTGANGLAFFICNVLKDTAKATLKVKGGAPGVSAVYMMLFTWLHCLLSVIMNMWQFI